MKQLFIISILLLIAGCQKEKITVSSNTSEVFYVENAGASQGSSNGNKLHLDQMVDDLKKVIEVLKYRYGQDMKLFLLGHSFGGLILADFITRPGFQNMINGLIDVDGSHNYPLNDTLTRQRLLAEGQYQVAQKRHISEWQPMTAILSNLMYSEDSDFNEELAVTNFSPALKIVTTPVLVLWGKYDFICPISLGEDFYNRISSTDKRMSVSPRSGHNMILQDKKFFCNEVASFITTHN